MFKSSAPYWAATALVAAVVLVRTTGNVPASQDEPITATSEKAESASDLQLRYARTWLALTEAQLNRVREANRRVAGAYPGAVVAEHERMVASAKAQLEETRTEDGDPEYAAYLRDAKAGWATARAEFGQAEAVNQHRPGSFDSATMEILRLRVELAHLLHEKGQSAAEQSRASQVEWQLTQLRHEVFRLRDELAKNQSGRYIRRYRYID